MAQDQSQLTDMMMVNPWMFDPSQLSNQFSNYNNQAMPWPPTYNTAAGGPVSAATGQPIQSFQAWQQANPGGTTLNNTASQPAAAAAPQASAGLGGSSFNAPTASNPYSTINPAAFQGSFAGGVNPATGQTQMQAQRQLQNYYNPTPSYSAPVNGVGGGAVSYGPSPQSMGMPAPGSQQQAAPQQQASGAPNNWYAALNALSNPGTPAIGGATVPMQTGSQPAGGVNNAFLQQAQGRPGMNQGFLSALSAIQGRPQQGVT